MNIKISPSDKFYVKLECKKCKKKVEFDLALPIKMPYPEPLCLCPGDPIRTELTKPSKQLIGILKLHGWTGYNPL